MRGRRSGAALARPPLNIFSATSIFTRNISGLAAATNQIPAKKIANQMAYGSQTYEHWYGYTGPGYGPGAGESGIQPPSTFAPSLYVVPAGQPTQKVTLLEHEGEDEVLRAAWEHVPVPTLSLVPSGSLWTPEGTDKWVTVWQPSTNKMWEFWNMGGTEGAWTAKYGGFYEGVSNWNGIFTNGMGARATGLALIGGMISIQDIVEILLNNTPIQHALAVGLPVTQAPSEEGPIAPATRHDTQANNTATIPAGKPKEGEANPAAGTVDGVAESNWFRLPSSWAPEDSGIAQKSEPIAHAIGIALRERGFFVGDSVGSAPKAWVESMQSAGSIYSYAAINPFRTGTPAEWNPGKYTWAANQVNPSLPLIQEEPKNLLKRMPWQLVERIEPRSS